MATDLIFPRVVYRGLPDTLGRGVHSHPETGETVGETKAVTNQDEYDAALKDGWRATREDPKAAKADDHDTIKVPAQTLHTSAKK